jgi:hypothetical protein
LRKRSLNHARAVPAAAAVAAAALALAAAGCGGGGDQADSERTARALTGLYAIDHDGANPKGNALEPYETAFDKVREDCDGTVEELASGIQTMSFAASNGSGTFISNLDALLATGRYLDEDPPPDRDCRGVFVGVEALLQGSALEG